MTAVRHTCTLREGRTFTVYNESGRALDTLVFVEWESSPLVAVVSRHGTRFTLGMEPGTVGVDESVHHDASFVALGRPEPALRRSISATT